jgi:GTP pyrophosphokinase
MFIDVEVTDLKHLNSIISHLRARPVVSKIERVNG